MKAGDTLERQSMAKSIDSNRTTQTMRDEEAKLNVERQLL